MINPSKIKCLFNPHEFDTFDFQDFLNVTGLTMKKYLKILVEDECSKSIDESCINSACPYNHFKMHKDELYIEVMQEIQAERREIEERTQRQMQEHYGTSFGGG